MYLTIEWILKHPVVRYTGIDSHSLKCNAFMIPATKCIALIVAEVTVVIQLQHQWQHTTTQTTTHNNTSSYNCRCTDGFKLLSSHSIFMQYPQGRFDAYWIWMQIHPSTLLPLSRVNRLIFSSMVKPIIRDSLFIAHWSHHPLPHEPDHIGHLCLPLFH